MFFGWRKLKFWGLLLVLLIWGGTCAYGSSDKLVLDVHGKIISNVPFKITVKVVDAEGNVDENFNGDVLVSLKRGHLWQVVGEKKEPLASVHIQKGKAELDNVLIDKGGKNVFYLKSKDLPSLEGEKSVFVIVGILSILPPLVAIVLALALRQVIISLFFGVWLGATFIYDFNPFTALLRVLDTIIINALADSDHVSIVVFSLCLGGMVAVVSRSGGSQGMVNIIQKWAKDARSGQIATWAMGLLIFFDDYANTLIVGNSMRPLTDRLKISREKLSFLVDATAAPVTNVAIISTWIGFEIGVIGDSLKTIGLNREPYMVFIQSIPYRFYPIILILFVFLVAYMMRDFGPMLLAEARARQKGLVLAPGAKPLSTIDVEAPERKNVPGRWYNAVVPILSVILLTILGLWYSGAKAILDSGGQEALKGATLLQILNNANSFQVLLWASFGGSLIAILMVLFQKIMTLEESITTWIEGCKSIIPAIVILTLAWSIGSICKDLKTGGYLATIAHGNIPPQLLPFLIFLMSAVISFATGTSWGTMSIVMPIAVYVGYHLPPATMSAYLKNAILLGSISGVLAGATFGDHCSPISDTTIMSSMASAADHIDHVRTQMPYAITVAAVGMIFGTIPIGFGFNPYLSLILCSVVVYLILRFIGKNPETYPLKENLSKKDGV